MRLFTAEAAILMMAVLVAGTPSRASAQEPAERIRLGPLGVKPVFRTSVTHDDNLFLDPANPTADIATMFSPDVRASLNMGRMRLVASNASSFVHYRKSREEPSANTTNAVRFEAALTRFKPFVLYGFTNVRDRPNQEIDTRVRYHVAVAGAGTQIQLAHRTSIGVDIHRSSTRFEDEANFLGTSLSRSLDRTSNIGTAAVRYELTPLTRLVVLSELQRDDFESGTREYMTMLGMRPGVEFAPTALLRGTALVGYRKAYTHDAKIPDYSGLVAAVDLGYVFRGRSRFSVRADRDVVYSFSEILSYYVQTGLTLNVVRQVTERISATGGAVRQWQRYPEIFPAITQTSSALSSLAPVVITSWQGGVGFQMTRTVRLGVNIDRIRRTDNLRGGYVTTRISSGVTYEP